jgi:hypothetical protein
VGRFLAAHPGGVEQHDEPDGAAWWAALDRPADPGTDRFAAIVAALRRDDPRFARRVSAPPPHGPAVGDLMLFFGLVASVLLGVVPLAVGIQLGAPALIVLGAVGCLVLPAGGPVAVRVVLRRVRPLMR